MSPPGPTHHILVKEKGQPASITPSPVLLDGVPVCNTCTCVCSDLRVLTDPSEDNVFSFVCKRRRPLVAYRLNAKGQGNFWKGVGSYKVTRGAGQGRKENKEREGPLEKGRVQTIQDQPVDSHRGIPAVAPHSPHPLLLSLQPILIFPSPKV